MGDRTSVSLMILKSDAAIAEPIMGECDHHYEDDTHCFYDFNEVNYGELECLGDLQNAGIPFNSTWDHGGDYGPGTDYCRFAADGSVERFSVSDSAYNPDLEELMELIAKPEELIKYIVTHYNQVTPLPWDHQAEYAKIFRAKQLINPT